MFVFRIDGRGGQGVDVATRILGRAGLLSGFNTQAFCFSGPERRGSQVTGTVKMDKGFIFSRQDEPPDFLVLMDLSLDTNEIMKSVKDGGLVLFNASERHDMAYLKKHKIKGYRVNANEISMATINRPIPNTAMLGAVAKLFGKISLKSIKKAAESELGSDDANKKAIDEGYRGVKA